MTNIINLTDSYKFSHFNQYPKGTEIIHSYLAPRGGEYEKVVMHGLPYILREYLEGQVFDQGYLLESEGLANKHGVLFNKQGWEYILKQYSGKLPIEIKALPEGTIVGNKEPLLTIENTDPNCAWLVGYLETLLLKIWYPITIASKSLAVKEILLKHWEKTADNIAGVDFAYHNFGDRGSSSVESASIGGVAHLTQFKGTDNFNCLEHSNKYYNGKYQGYSIPASEHLTVTSWGRENEFAMIENYLETYKSSPIIACVLDSYDIYKAVDFVTSGKMKEKIESADYPVFVIRPDSGNPIEVISNILQIMMINGVKGKLNSKGFITFDKYRIIWGDGITPSQIDNILNKICYQFTNQIFSSNPLQGFSAQNFAFGSGGDLMQNVSRDILKFAMKCSAIKVNGEWRDVYKDPITDQGKKSIRGRVEDSRFITVFKNGEILC
jgi:nicotinamide phosphoribosyltransferase